MLTPRKLGHVGIYVRDLERSKKFYTEVVGLKVSDELAGRAVFLRCGHDHMDKTIEFRDPDDNLIQFYCDMDQIGWDDRSRPPTEWRRQEQV